MKKLIFAVVALFVLAAPAFAQFSVSASLEATYKQDFAPNLRWGVDASLDTTLTPAFGLGATVTPYLRYRVVLVDDGALNLAAFARLNVPITVSFVPSPVDFSVSLSPRAGLDLSYKLSESLELLSRLQLAFPITLVPSTGFNYALSIPYIELDYYAGDLTLYGGTSFDLLPSAGWGGLYAGALYNLSEKMYVQGELSAGAGGDFSVIGLLLKLSIALD